MQVLQVGQTDKYDIIITSSFKKLGQELMNIVKPKKVLIITDQIVDEIYSDEIIKEFNDFNIKIFKYVIKSGEKSKNLKTVNCIYSKCIEIGLDRSSCIVALGGGVVGDISGFVAATFFRGIMYIQVPTTLLAQVDSSIGGKTGVDFKGSKNIIGSFYNPKLVYTNIETLKTLDPKQYISAMGEIIKYSILNNDIFEIVNVYIHEIQSRDSKILEQLIYQCCKFKSQIVSNDQNEKGERIILNLGHTIGHAIESSSNFKILHGKSVALGLLAVLKMSLDLNKIKEIDYKKSKKIIFDYITFDDLKLPATDRIIKNLQRDKKIINDQIRFVLPIKIGAVEICNDISFRLIRETINTLLK